MQYITQNSQFPFKILDMKAEQHNVALISDLGRLFLGSAESSLEPLSLNGHDSQIEENQKILKLHSALESD